MGYKILVGFRQNPCGDGIRTGFLGLQKFVAINTGFKQETFRFLDKSAGKHRLCWIAFRCNHIHNTTYYSVANTAQANHQFDRAIELYTHLGNFRDSIARLLQCYDAAGINYAFFDVRPVNAGNKGGYAKTDAVTDKDLQAGWQLTAEKIGDGLAYSRVVDLDSVITDSYGNTLTNTQRILAGNSPVDPSTGIPYELHHIGQEPTSPLAILTKAEHMQGGHNKILHFRMESEVEHAAAWADQVDDFWLAYLSNYSSAAA